MIYIIVFSLIAGFGWGNNNFVAAEANKSIGILSTSVYPESSIVKFGLVVVLTIITEV